MSVAQAILVRVMALGAGDQTNAMTLAGRSPPLVADIAVVGQGVAAAMCVKVASDAGLKVAWLAADDATPEHGPELLSTLSAVCQRPPGSLADAATEAVGKMLRSLRDRRVDWPVLAAQKRNLRFLAHRALPARHSDPDEWLLACGGLIQHAVRLYRACEGEFGVRLIEETPCVALLERDDAEGLRRLKRAVELATLTHADAEADLAALASEPDVGTPKRPRPNQARIVAATGSFVARPDLLMAHLAQRRLPVAGLFKLSPALSMQRQDDVWSVQTKHREVQARHVIILSIEELQALMPSVGHRLPFGRVLVAWQHFAALTQDFQPHLDGRGRFQAVATGRGVRISLSPKVLQTRMEAERQLRAIAVQHLSGFVGEPRDMVGLKHVWVTPDGLPIAGEISGHRGLWLNVGYGNEEGGASLAMSQLVLAWARGRPMSDIWRALSPDRYLNAATTPQKPPPEADGKRQD